MDYSSKSYIFCDILKDEYRAHAVSLIHNTLINFWRAGKWWPLYSQQSGRANSPGHPLLPDAAPFGSRPFFFKDSGASKFPQGRLFQVRPQGPFARVDDADGELRIQPLGKFP